jgi:hypothetical protein
MKRYSRHRQRERFAQRVRPSLEISNEYRWSIDGFENNGSSLNT